MTNPFPKPEGRPPGDASPGDRVEQFVQLVTLHQSRLFLFILSLLPNRSDAEEVLQETNLVLWRKFDEFRPGSDFRAWAFQIAYFKVQKLREQRGQERLHFHDQFVERVATVAQELPDDHDARKVALAGCLGKLSDRDRDLVQRRYADGGTSSGVAEQVGRSVEAVYKALVRIRGALQQCIERTLTAENR